MTDKAFADGMLAMGVTFPDRDEPAEVKAARSSVYRRLLGQLPDEAWLFAVDQALRRTRWFPTPAELLEYADQYEPPAVKALPAPRSPEQVEQDRAAARASLRVGLGMIIAEARKAGLKVPDTIGDWPTPGGKRRRRRAEQAAR